jgi:hypothetical protein
MVPSAVLLAGAPGAGTLAKSLHGSTVEGGTTPSGVRGRVSLRLENAMQLKPPRRPRHSAAHAPATPKRRPAEPDDPWAGEDAAWECDDDLRGETPRQFMRFFRGTALAVVLGVAVWAALLLLLFQAW